jgi:hypothetical protein
MKKVLYAIFVVSGLVLCSQAQDSLNVTRVGQVAIAATKVVVSGNYAYVAGTGLSVVDISNPSAPVVVGSLATSGTPMDIAMLGNRVYISWGMSNPWYNWYGGVVAVDVSTPSSPVIVGSWSCLHQHPLSLCVNGNYVYVGIQAGPEIVYGAVTILDRNTLTQVGTCNTQGYVQGISVNGNFAYAAQRDYFAVPNMGFLSVVNVQYPSAPIELGYCVVHAWGNDTAANDSIAGVAADDAGFRVINVSNPIAPYEVGSYNPGGYALAVTLSGSTAYLAYDSGGLRIVNLSNPANPVLTGYYNTPGTASDVFLSGGYIFVADGTSLGIYRETPPNVRVTVVPLNPAIQIPAQGGSFNYNLNLANLSTSPSTFNYWIMLRRPDNSWFGPINPPATITLGGSASPTRLRTQNVPANTPAGSYWYEARIGIYPAVIVDTSGFAFTKLAAGDGMSIGDWTCCGDEIQSESSADLFQIPEGFGLESAYPNPFNPSTTIKYKLSRSGITNLSVYDVSGVKIAELVNGNREVGSHQTAFDVGSLSSGVYLVRLQQAEQMSVLKLVLMK